MADVFLGHSAILENRWVASETYVLRLAAPEVVQRAVPGQFIMVRTGAHTEKGCGPLLKRPFSIHRLGPNDEISLLYRVVGKGTHFLACVRPGESLEVLGPLGRGFFAPPSLKKAYLAAGGIGLAPLLALADSLPDTDLCLYYGERISDFVVSEDILNQFPCRRVTTTEDGLVGIKSLVTLPLEEALASDPAPVFACGPRPMLAAVAGLSKKYGVEAQVSLEAHMACGLGACLGCVTEVRSKQEETAYARVCMEGPVFRAEEVVW